MNHDGGIGSWSDSATDAELLRRNTADREEVAVSQDRRRSRVIKKVASASSKHHLVPPAPTHPGAPPGSSNGYTPGGSNRPAHKPGASFGMKFKMGEADAVPFEDLEEFDDIRQTQEIFEEPDWDELEGPAAAPLGDMGNAPQTRYSMNPGLGSDIEIFGEGQRHDASQAKGAAAGTGSRGRANTAAHVKDARDRAASRARQRASKPAPPGGTPPRRRTSSVGHGVKPNLTVKPGKQRMLKRKDTLTEGVDHRSELLRRHMCACRVLICGIAVALLWCTPLYVAKQLVAGYLHMPSADTSINRCTDLMAWASETRSEYDNCVAEQDWQCRSRWEQALPLAVAQLKAKQESNANALNLHEVRAQACVDVTAAVHKRFQDWANMPDATTGKLANANFLVEGSRAAPYNASAVAAGGAPPSGSAFAANASTEDRAVVVALINARAGQSLALSRDAAELVAKGYAKDARAKVDAYERYLLAVQAYNAAYLRNRTGGLDLGLNESFADAQAALAAAASASAAGITGALNSSFAPLQAAGAAVADGTSTAVKGVLNAATEVQDYGIVAYDAYADNLKGAQRSYADVKAKLAELKSWKEKYYDNVVNNGIVDFGADATFPSLTDTFDPSLTEITKNIRNLPDVGNAIKDEMNKLGDAIGVNASQALQDARDMSASAANAVAGALPRPNITTGFEDYNPPKYADYDPQPGRDFDAVTDDYEADNDAALQDMSTAALNGTNGGGGSNSSKNPGIVRTISNATQRLGAFSSSFTKNVWERLRAQDDEITALKQLKELLPYLATILIWCDIVYRIWRTLSLIAHFWSKSVLDLPPADVRLRGGLGDVASGKKCNCIGSNFSPFRCYVKCITHPAVGFGIAITFVLIFYLGAEAFYMPWLTLYKRGCVTQPANYTTTPPELGTLLTNNIYSIARNYALEEGNNRSTVTLDSYNAVRESECTRYVEQSSGQAQLDEERLLRARAAFDGSAHEVRLLRTSLNLTYFGAALPSFASGLAVGADACVTAPPSVCNTPAATTDAAAGDLTAAGFAVGPCFESSGFDCAAQLPQCNPTCRGPSTVIMGQKARRCGCTTESWFHAGAVFMLVALFVYVSTNFARIVLVSHCRTCSLARRRISPSAVCCCVILRLATYCYVLLRLLPLSECRAACI